MKKTILISLAALALAGAAEAQPKFKDYPQIEVTIPKGPNDPSLEVFRASLTEIARNKDAAALQKLVDRGFFWERDFGGGFDRKKSGFVNFASALSLNAGDGTGWRQLEKFASALPGPHDKRKGVFCGPASPKIDDKAFEKLLKDTDSDVFDWAYPAHANVIAREKGEPGAAEVAKLSGHLVFTDLAARGPDFDYEKGWTPVITHDGKKAFVAPGELHSALDPRLCFTRRGGKWTIAGYIGGGD
jgi:hypothetical protein